MRSFVRIHGAISTDGKNQFSLRRLATYVSSLLQEYKAYLPFEQFPAHVANLFSTLTDAYPSTQVIFRYGT